MPIFCIGEFLRVITHPRLFSPPHLPAEACDALRHLLASPSVRLLSPGESYASLLEATIREAEARGNLVFDAQVVALCVEHGVEAVLTEDRDFDRFRGLRTLRLAR